MLVCLAVLFADKADDFVRHSDDSIHAEIFSEIRNSHTDFVETTEKSLFSAPEPQCRVPRQTNYANSLRINVQAHRNYASGHQRSLIALSKSGKAMNENAISDFIRPILDFPSGLNENAHHLISLRKLII